MRRMFLLALVVLAGCSTPSKEAPKAIGPAYFKVDSATAGSVKGIVHFTGKKPAPARVDMSGDPACVDAHKGAAIDESLVLNRNGTLSNVFVYIKRGLEDKKFAPPAAPVVIDQRGCWFHPRVLGIQTGQTLQVTNSDPVTHNIHPLAHINREWNHSQGPEEAPLARIFLKPEIMVRVKCNIHSWMHAYIGALDHPYFAVTGADGTFVINNVPPGQYVVEAWQELLGVREQSITVTSSGKLEAAFTFKGE